MASEATTNHANAHSSRVTRVVLALGILAVCAVVALVLVATRRDAPGPTGAVEERVRRELTQPGPDQMAPDGERVESVSCREAERGFQCRVAYPSGLELDCFMGAGEVAPGPYCATPQGRVRSAADLA